MNGDLSLPTPWLLSAFLACCTLFLLGIFILYRTFLRVGAHLALYIPFARSFIFLPQLGPKLRVFNEQKLEQFVAPEDRPKVHQIFSRPDTSGTLMRRDEDTIWIFQVLTLPLVPIKLCIIFDDTFQQQQSKRLSTEISNYKNALSQLPWPLWVQKDQTLMLCNEAYGRIFDLSPAIIKRENRLLNQTRDLRFDADTDTSELVTLNIGGERKIYQFARQQFSDGSQIIYGTDLTERENQKAGYLRHIDAYREILDKLSAGVTIYGADRRLKHFNHAYLRMFDFDEGFLFSEPTVGEILDDLRVRRLLTEYADYPAYRREQMDSITSSLTLQERLLHLPDNRVIRRISAPHPLGGSFYIFEDVTNTLMLEQKYNTQLAVQKASLDNLYEGVAVFGSDNRLRLYNPAFARIWRLSPDQLYEGRHLADLAEEIKGLFNVEEDWESYKARVISRVTDRVPKKRLIHRRDQSVLEFSYMPLPDGSNLMSYIDVTDRFEIERLLRERNQVLEAADQIKSGFIANVSYELRTPLNSIVGFTELLTNQYFGKLNKKQLMYCHNILNASQKLLMLVNDVLDLAMIQSGYMKIEKTAIQLEQFLKDVLKHIHKEAHDPVTIELHAPPSLKRIYGDPHRLKQAIYNICFNAYKTSTPPTEIHIFLEMTANHQIRMTFQTKTHFHSMPQTAPSVTPVDPISKGLESYAGIGIGFTLVRSIMELHGGTLTIDVNTPQEKVVKCVLPCLEEETQSLAQAA